MTRPDPARLRLIIAYVVLAAFALNFARGILPFTLVEGDEQGVLNGVLELTRGQPDPRWLYLYPLHAGSHQLIRVLVSVGVPSPEMAFGLATVLGGLTCLVCASIVAVRLTGVAWPFATLWLVAIPELSAACFFLNTSVIGGAFAWGALVLAAGRGTRGRAVLAGLLLGLAGWMRIDALSLAPAAPLLWWRFDRAAAVRFTLIAAGTALGALLLLWFAQNIGWREVVAIWTDRTATPQPGHTTRILVLAFGPVMLLSVFVALIRNACRREIWWLLFAAATAGPTLLAHGRFLTTPKYLYFLLPVLGIVALAGISDCLKSQARAVRMIAVAAIAALVCDWSSAIRSWSPERQRFNPGPPVARLLTVGPHLSWVIGLGELPWTDDGYRARGGYWFVPTRWRHDKLATRATLRELAEFVQQPRMTGIVTCGWVARQAAVATLLRGGFTAGPAKLQTAGELSNYVQDWTGLDGRTCRQLAIGVFGHALLPTMLPELAGRDVFFVTDQAWRPTTEGGLAWPSSPDAPDAQLATVRVTAPPALGGVHE